MIKWEPRYSVGDEAVDRQHKLLFEFFNDLQEVIQEGKQASYLTTGLPFLENYAKAHFHYEENCMIKHKCPVAGENKTAHEIFLTTLQQFKKRTESNPSDKTLIIEMHQFLEKWITSHIIGIDMHLKACIKNESHLNGHP